MNFMPGHRSLYLVLDGEDIIQVVVALINRNCDALASCSKSEFSELIAPVRRSLSELVI